MINELSHENGVDAALVFAIADVESGFRNSVVSTSGAVGLMQIMPDTARWVAGKLGQQFSDGCLSDAHTNLWYGCYYISYLKNKFAELWQVLAAYNAGEGRVKEWIASGVTVKTIPYAETRKYVVKVLKMQKYYSGKKFVLNN